MTDLLLTLLIGILFGAIVVIPAFVLLKQTWLQLLFAFLLAAVGLGIVWLFLGHIGGFIWNWETLVAVTVGLLITWALSTVVRSRVGRNVA